MVPKMFPNVKALQAQYKLQPLERLPETAGATGRAAIDFPPYDRAKARTHDFIGYLNFLLQFAEPPHPERSRDPQAF